MGSIHGNQELGKNSVNFTISEFLGQVSMIADVSERLRKLDDYIWRLEDEMRKVKVFQNELPLSLLILNDAIVAVKEEAVQCKKLNTEPVFEQFIPIKKICEEKDDKKVEILKESENSKEKMNWLSSVQLWDSNSNNKQGTKSDTRKRIDDDLNSMKSSESRAMGISFGTFKGYSGLPLEIRRKEEEVDLPLVPELSLGIAGRRNSKDDIFARGLSFNASCRTGSSSTSNGQSRVFCGSQSQQQQINRKERRCWSPELHRRFVEALGQLGGAQVATPKQIRDIMQVDSLTNDEVKSHLQKYRLHIKKDPATKASTQDHSLASGGLWSSPEKFGETPKQSDSQSGSPYGPFQFDKNSGGTSTSAGDSMEDENDEKSESGSWKSHHAHSAENDRSFKP